MKTSAFSVVASGLGFLAVILSPAQFQAQVPSGIEDPAFPAASRAISAAAADSHQATDLVRGPDGTVWLTGTITSTAPNPRPTPIVTKLTAAGEIDTTYGTNGTVTLETLATGSNAHAIAPLADGQLIVAYATSASLKVRRLTTQGTQDLDFGTLITSTVRAGETTFSALGEIVEVRTILIEPDGKIVIHASVRSSSTSTYHSLKVFRLLPTGSKDTTFGTSSKVGFVDASNIPSLQASTIAPLPNGGYSLLTAAAFGSQNPPSIYVQLEHLRNNGLPAASNNEEFVSPLLPITYAARLKFDAATSTTWVLGPSKTSPAALCLVRLRIRGQLETAFSTDGLTTGATSGYESTARDLEQSPDGRIYITGFQTSTSNPLEPRRGFLMCFRPDGVPDTTFASGNNFTVSNTTANFGGGFSRLLLQPDGHVLVAGYKAQLISPADQPGTYGTTRYLTGAPPAYDAPVITSAPADQTHTSPNDITMTVQAAPNVLEPWYRWTRNGLVISNTATAAVTSHWSNQGNYTVEVGNFAGVATHAFQITIPAPPAITQEITFVRQPGWVRFTVGMSGRLPATVQWFRNDVSLGPPAGFSQPETSWSVLDVSASAGIYHAVITNADGTAASQSIAYAPVPDYPVVVTQPEPDEDLAPFSTTLSVTVTGKSPFTFQWQKDGVNVGAPETKSESPSNTGTVTTSYSVAPNGATSADSGNYRCIISNAFGWTATQDTAVIIHDKAAIRLPQDRQIIYAQNELYVPGKLFTFEDFSTVTWLHNGRKIAGATSPEGYFQPSATLADAGTYQLRVNTTEGALISNIATVAVVDPLPRATAAKTGGSITLHAAAAGPGLYHTWRRVDGQPLEDPRITGIHTTALKITSVTPADAADYVCDVAWAAYHGPTVSCGAVTLEIATQTPVMAHSVLPTGRILSPYRYTIAALHPASRFTITGLPRGLTYDPATGTISGAPVEAGTFQLRASASNPFGTSPAITIPLTIATLAPGAAGIYMGPISDQHGYGIGIAQINVSTTGHYTGKLVFKVEHLAIRTVPMSGQLRDDGSGNLVPQPVLFHVPSSPENGTVLAGLCELRLYWAPGFAVWTPPQATILTSSGGQIAITLHKALFSATTPATGYTGYSTYTMQHNLGYETLGNGYGSMTVQPSGAVTISGRLPGSGAFTGSSFVVAKPESTEYVRTYIHTWMTNPKNYICGWFEGITSSVDGYLSGDLFWRHHYNPATIWSGNVLSKGVATRLSIGGGIYVPPNQPGRNGNALNIPPPARVISYFNILHADQDQFNASGTLTNGHMLTFDAAQPGDPFASAKITFQPATGLFTGTATHREYDDDGTLIATHPTTFQGIVLRGNNGNAGEIVPNVGHGFYSYPYKATIENEYTGKTATLPYTHTGAFGLEQQPPP